MSTQATVSVSVSRTGIAPNYAYQVTASDVTITNPGSGYTSGTVIFSPSKVTGTCNFSSGALQSITITNSGYGTGAFTASATISAPNVTPVNNTDLVSVSNQLGLGGSLDAAAGKTYVDSNSGNAVTVSSTPSLTELATLVQ